MSVWDKAIDAAENRWHRGELVDDYGNVCAIGAILEAVHGRGSLLGHISFGGDTELTNQMISELGQVIRSRGLLYGPDLTTIVWRYNDHYCKSGQELADLMREAKANTKIQEPIGKELKGWP